MEHFVSFSRFRKKSKSQEQQGIIDRLEPRDENKNRLWVDGDSS